MKKKNYVNLAVLSVFLIGTILLTGVVFAVSIYGDTNTEVRAGSDTRVNAGVSANVSGSSDVSVAERERVRAHILSRTRIGLNLSEDDVNSSNGAILRARLSNGRYADIRVMPDRASIIARENIRARCELNNCTFELREIGARNETRAAYRVRVEKDARVLGLFRARMNIDVDVDAETGEVIQVNRPWWASISSEEEADVDSEINTS